MYRCNPANCDFTLTHICLFYFYYSRFPQIGKQWESHFIDCENRRREDASGLGEETVRPGVNGEE